MTVAQCAGRGGVGRGGAGRGGAGRGGAECQGRVEVWLSPCPSPYHVDLLGAPELQQVLCVALDLGEAREEVGQLAHLGQVCQVALQPPALPHVEVDQPLEVRDLLEGALDAGPGQQEIPRRERFEQGGWRGGVIGGGCKWGGVMGGVSLGALRRPPKARSGARPRLAQTPAHSLKVDTVAHVAHRVGVDARAAEVERSELNEVVQHGHCPEDLLRARKVDHLEGGGWVGESEC